MPNEPAPAPALVLVPAEPTEAMKVAGGVAFENAAFGDECDVFEAAGLAYKAMMEAAGAAVPADPLDTPLPCEVVLPGMRFGKGVKLRTLVDAAARWKAQASMAAFPNGVRPEDIASLREAVSAFNAVPPGTLKEPSKGSAPDAI